MIYGLVAPFKAEKRKVNVDDVWFRVSPLSLSLRAGDSSRLPSFNLASLSGNLSFISIFSSDLIKLGFFVFYREGHRLAEKLLLIIFIF